MSMNFKIADTITRIRNAQLARKSFTFVDSSKFIKAVLNVLKNEGFIQDFQEFNQRDGINLIKVDLKYFKGQRVIESIDLISKPGCRVYGSVEDLSRTSVGLGMVIVSTSKGVMADHQAIEENVGGELICKVI